MHVCIWPQLQHMNDQSQIQVCMHVFEMVAPAISVIGMGELEPKSQMKCF